MVCWCSRIPDAGWIAARREFGSDTWGAAAFQATGIVYFSATLTVDVAQGWLHICALDGEGERVQFGMPWQGGGIGYLGIRKETTGVNALSDIPVTIGQPYRIVGVLDYTNNAARMWIDPDPGDYDLPNKTSADVVFSNLEMWNWVNGVRLSSGSNTKWDDLIVATTFPETFIPGSFTNRPHDPDPAVAEIDVPINSTLSWTVAQDPNGLVDPNLVSMKLYMAIDPDPNFVFVDDIISWDAGTLRASYTPAPLSRDKTYRWRVDSIQDSEETVEGYIWSFETIKSVPKIISGPDYQVVDADATAVFTVTVESISPETYQWYRYVDGISDTALSDEGDISGATSASLEIAHAEIADEGTYYCIVINEAAIPVSSKKVMLAVKRKIAYWPFDDSNAQSTVSGSPTSLLNGDPVFGTGILSGAMVFEGDLLYTDPDQVSYFDICNYSMTVSCWVKATSAASWGPLVARNGEDGQGWQLRQSNNTKRICFTTRGTGNDDGTASDRTVYDGTWHYAVGTYDGTAKKVYIDGVISRVYNIDDGTLDFDSDTASGLVSTTLSPVSLAGRVRGAAGSLTFESYTPCTLDDVSVYNYPLSADAIAQIYANVTGKSVCPEHPVNDLDGNCIVDLNDFARIASDWLEDGSVLPIL